MFRFHAVFAFYDFHSDTGKLFASPFLFRSLIFSLLTWLSDVDFYCLHFLLIPFCSISIFFYYYSSKIRVKMPPQRNTSSVSACLLVLWFTCVYFYYLPRSIDSVLCSSDFFYYSSKLQELKFHLKGTSHLFPPVFFYCGLLALTFFFFFFPLSVIRFYTVSIFLFFLKHTGKISNSQVYSICFCVYFCFLTPRCLL